MAASTASASPVQAAAAAPIEAQKPKKAVSGYWIFTGKVREEVSKEIKEKNGGKASLGDTAKAMAAKWAALTAEEKKPFEEQAVEDKKRYEAELKVYQEAMDPAGVLRKKYEHLIPKKPMTPYFLFSQDTVQREKAAALLKEAGAEASNKQIVGKLAELWKAASTEEKAPFEERNKKESAEFLQKQKEWQATPEFAEIEKAAKQQAERKAAAGEGEEAVEAKGTKRGRSVPKGKKEDAGKADSPAAAKRAKPSGEKASTKAAAKAKAPEVAIDADVLAEASKAGMDGMLRNLAGRPEVVASGKSSREIFKALQVAGGLVNPAKRALVGAGGA